MSHRRAARCCTRSRGRWSSASTCGSGPTAGSSSRGPAARRWWAPRHRERRRIVSGVVDLARCAELPVAVVGGKAQALGRLSTAGVPVPRGFCLVDDALQDFLSASGLMRVVADLTAPDAHPATLGARLAALRRYIRDADMPDRIGRAVLDAARSLGAERFAVRSSAPHEDGPAHTAAGVYDSVLDVRPRELVDAVKQVWASLFSERVNYYLGGRFPAHMAVVVQEQVRAQRTGVVFTSHPLTGEPGYFAEESGTPEGVTSGTDARAVPAGPELRRLADRAAEILGGPVDMEFAVAPSGILVLQGRPVAGRAGPVDVDGVRWARQEDLADVAALPLGRCHRLLMRQLVKHVPVRQVCRSLGIPVFEQ